MAGPLKCGEIGAAVGGPAGATVGLAVGLAATLAAPYVMKAAAPVVKATGRAVGAVIVGVGKVAVGAAEVAVGAAEAITVGMFHASGAMRHTSDIVELLRRMDESNSHSSGRQESGSSGQRSSSGSSSSTAFQNFQQGEDPRRDPERNPDKSEADQAERTYEEIVKKIKKLLEMLRTRLSLKNSEELMLLMQNLCRSIRQLLDTGHTVHLNSDGALNRRFDSASWTENLSRGERLLLRRRMFDAFEVLVDNGYSVRMSTAGVVIGNGSLMFDLGTEVPNFLTNFHEDLIEQQFERSSSDCSNVLEAYFNDRNELRLRKSTCQTKKNVIYGLRCRLCPDLRSGYRNVTYVGQTKYNCGNSYSLHNRVCLGRKADVKKMMESELELNRPFIEHVCLHLERKEDVGNVFGRAVDIILFPTGDLDTSEKVRCWEVFWQWLMQARKDQGGHSHR